MKYEIIVVGGGHAGCEAALASARKGHKTLLVTGNVKNIADMPCNPSIGGSAKGIVVREIDALGGEMAINADKSKLQMKLLNIAKGPAVQALRSQADKITYPKEMLHTLKATDNLDILEAMVEDLIIEEKVVKGVILKDKTKEYSSIVILTTGTYLKADILVGSTRKRSGPHGEEASNFLSDNLKKVGFNVIRLKTGTPQRIEKTTIDFSKTIEEKGDSVERYFSFDEHEPYDVNQQISCHLIYTTPKTHEIIKKNLTKASMYGGLNDITGIGPRYCPSIEDKIVRFSSKERHQLFLEPESIYYDDIYLQGFSTSMPNEVQQEMVHSLPGLEHAKINKYAYAIEYDAIYPTDIKPSLETKIIDNLYTAGQINGTSGYEEAACQGLMAGINAALKLEGKDPLVLKRNEAYIGVLIDDLVTKGIRDPYRLLSSRAEYRLLLRSDNADLRLRHYGYQVGLISEEKHQKLLAKEKEINHLKEVLRRTYVTPKENDYLQTLTSAILKDRISIYELLKRPEIKYEMIENYVNEKIAKEIIDYVEIEIKYEGYIAKAQKEVKKMEGLENKKIPNGINYDNIHNIANEAKQKLKEVQPTSLGQALRISGVNPSDITTLSFYLKKEYPNE